MFLHGRTWVGRESFIIISWGSHSHDFIQTHLSKAPSLDSIILGAKATTYFSVVGKNTIQLIAPASFDHLTVTVSHMLHFFSLVDHIYHWFNLEIVIMVKMCCSDSSLWTVIYLNYIILWNRNNFFFFYHFIDIGGLSSIFCFFKQIKWRIVCSHFEYNWNAGFTHSSGHLLICVGKRDVFYRFINLLLLLWILYLTQICHPWLII